MFCPKCGMEMTVSAKFCGKCGCAFAEKVKTVAGKEKDIVSLFDEKILAYIYRGVSIFVLLIFFVPTFLVSCSSGEKNLSCVSMLEYRDKAGGSEMLVWLLLFMLVVCAAGLLINSFFRKNEDYKDIKTYLRSVSGLVAMISLVEVVLWFLLYTVLNNVVKDYAYPASARCSPTIWYYLLILILIGQIAVSLPWTLINQELHKTTDSLSTRTVINSHDLKRYVYICFKCKKIYFLPDGSCANCDACSSKLVELGMDARRWELMSDREKATLASKAYMARR